MSLPAIKLTLAGHHVIVPGLPYGSGDPILTVSDKCVYGGVNRGVEPRRSR